MMERKEAIERIKKLMAVAGDESATENEVLVAIAMADNLRIKYKIAENEIEITSNEIKRAVLSENSYGYYAFPLAVLGNHFRCETTRCGRINGKRVQFFAYGFVEDIELLISVVGAMFKYFDHVLFGGRKYPNQKMKYSYLAGFSEGLRESLESTVKELDLGKKWEVAVVGVPKVVKAYARSIVQQAPRNEGYEIDVYSYFEGLESGLKYLI
ncbi:DUF2786 domain-containing protein [uncultured Dubosiella sp.]|uniref:DUF2786 domain-containing protein n=1 Tax=uncultured Dubosiella sp. TaxID=1937011 RepID=UPI00259BF2EC|nr:DUF2786 domain-containing protein [uncultured Dubosiella sp.]